MVGGSIVAFGHSHLGSMQRAYEERENDFPTCLDVKFLQLWGRYDPFLRNEAGGIVYNEELVADLMELAHNTNASALVATLLGSEHLFWAIDGQSRPFDVILPFAPDLPASPGAEIVPYALLLETASNFIDAYLMFCGWMHDMAKLPVYLVLPPPPVADEGLLVATAPEYMREIMDKCGIPHWTIRYKLWRIWNVVAMNVAKTSGIAVVGAPNGVTDIRGLLREELCGDCVHANTRYGHLMWQKLATILVGAA